MQSREVVGLVVLLGQVAAGGWAQAAPAAAPIPKSVRLGYKYREGAVTRMRFSSNGTIIVDISHLLPNAPGLLGTAVTADVAAQYDVIRTVKRINGEGSATLSFTLDNLSLRATIMDSAVVAKYQNGKASFFHEGMPVMPPGLGKGDPFAGRRFEARVSSRGKVLQYDGRLLEQVKKVFAGYEEFQVFQPVFLLPEVALLVLPPGEQTVGESWPDEGLPADAVHIATSEGATHPTESLTATTTFKELQQRGARQIAVIEQTVEMVDAPAADIRITGTRSANAGAPRVSISGVHLLDLGAGELRMSEFNAKISSRDEADSIHGGPASAIGIDANLDYKLTHAPMPDARPTAPPATGKPGQKKAAPRGTPKYRGAGSTYSQRPTSSPPDFGRS